MELVMILLIGGFFLSLAAWLIVLTSYYAYGRGYNPVVWALAAIIAMNPIFLFVVLALAPHRYASAPARQVPIRTGCEAHRTQAHPYGPFSHLRVPRNANGRAAWTPSGTAGRHADIPGQRPVTGA